MASWGERCLPLIIIPTQTQLRIELYSLLRVG